MSEQEWDAYMALLAQSRHESKTHCVACWYEKHGKKTPFPAKDSSCLCDVHAASTWNHSRYGQREAVTA